MKSAVTLLAVLAFAAPAAADPIDVGIDTCTELVPRNVATAPPDGETALGVRVLLDGVAEPRARSLFAEVQKAYAPLRVALRPTFEAVTFAGADYEKLLEQAHVHYGGRRPAGVDVVYTLTTKDLADAAGDTTTAGFADCIGGIAYPDQGFAVGEDRGGDRGAPLLGSLATGVAIPAEIAAHEIGHLLGAHHHYANCGEGITATDLDPCTVMFPDVCCTSLVFGRLEAAVIRGHVEAYAGKVTPAAPPPAASGPPAADPAPGSPAATPKAKTKKKKAKPKAGKQKHRRPAKPKRKHRRRPRH
jgi:hypothetical protein